MRLRKSIILVMCVAILGVPLFIRLKVLEKTDMDKKNSDEQTVEQATVKSVMKNEEKLIEANEDEVKIKENLGVEPQIIEAEIIEQENTKISSNEDEIRNEQIDKQTRDNTPVSEAIKESSEELNQSPSDNSIENQINPLTLEIEEYQDTYSEEVITFMRSDGQNEVTVDVTFNNPFKMNEQTKEYLVFEVLLNTHSFNIDENNLDTKITLKNDQGVIDVKQVSWIPDGPTTGHHVSGKLLIPKQVDSQNIIFQGIKFLELTMKDVAGVEQRLFRWDNEDIAFDKVN